jgi:hypothetical protein
VRVKPINFQTEALPAVRKKAIFGPQSADNFSELSLMEKTLALPFQAEYEGSIPFTRSMPTACCYY